MTEFKPTDAAMTAKHYDRESAIGRELRIGIVVVATFQIFALPLVPSSTRGYTNTRRGKQSSRRGREETGKGRQ